MLRLLRLAASRIALWMVARMVFAAFATRRVCAADPRLRPGLHIRVIRGMLDTCKMLKRYKGY